MTLRELIKNCGLTSADLDKQILFSNDEELNCLHKEAQISQLGDTEKFVLFPLSGTEVEE